MTVALLASGKLTLKQHRFEIGTAVIASILVGAMTLWINARLAAADVPGTCFPVWLSAATDLTPACSDALNAFQEIVNSTESVVLFAGLGILPFAAGLIAGVPVVGRELELRTASTAWALAASRRRWFARQLLAIVVVFGLAMTFVAVAATFFEATRAAYFSGVLNFMGLFGPLLLARALVALSLGLISGAVIGRTLPALIVGSVLSIGLLFLVSTARQSWIDALPRVELNYAEVSTPMFRGMWDSEMWRASDGRLVDQFAAFALVPGEGQTDPYAWLDEHGYEHLVFGVTAETLRQWEPIEIGAMVSLGLLLVVWTVAIVEQKRPS